MTRAAERRFNADVDVANPIYDVVFKYLMQNDRVARLLIGRITGLAVQSSQELGCPRILHPLAVATN